MFMYFYVRSAYFYIFPINVQLDVPIVRLRCCSIAAKLFPRPIRARTIYDSC